VHAAHDDAVALVEGVGPELVAVEVLDPRRRRLDGGPEVGADRVERTGDLGLGHAGAGLHRPVEALGELAHGGVAPPAHVGQDRLHRSQRAGPGAVGAGQVRPQVAGDATEVESVQHDGSRYKPGRGSPRPVPGRTSGARRPVDRGDGQRPGRSLVNSHPAR
jgi:hypothetical protein